MVAAALILGSASFAVVGAVPAGQGVVSGPSASPLVESVRTVVRIRERRGMGGRCMVRKKVVRIGGMKRVKTVRVCH